MACGYFDKSDILKKRGLAGIIKTQLLLGKLSELDINTIASNIIKKLENYIPEGNEESDLIIKQDLLDFLDTIPELNVNKLLMSRLRDVISPVVVENESDPVIVDENSKDNGEFSPFIKTWDRFDKLFFKYPDIRKAIIDKFKTEIVSKFLVDYDAGKILMFDPKAFNEAIFRYKLILLEDLDAWLRSSNKIDVEKPETMSINGELTSEGFEYYQQVIQAAAKVFTPSYMPEINYAKNSLDSNSAHKYNAFYAYLLLSSDNYTMSFDDLLIKEFPKMFKITKGKLFFGSSSNPYSLSFERATTKPFGNDRMEDGEKTMGVLGRLLITTIPKRENGKIVGYITFDEATALFKKLLDHTNYNKLGSELGRDIAELYTKFQTNPLEAIQQLMHIFQNEIQARRSIIHFTADEMNIMQSIYYQLFDETNKKSLISIQNKYYRQTGNIQNFDLVSTCIGSFIRQEVTHYLQTRTERDSSERISRLTPREITKRNEQRRLISFQDNIANDNAVSSNLSMIIGKYALRFKTAIETGNRTDLILHLPITKISIGINASSSKLENRLVVHENDGKGNVQEVTLMRSGVRNSKTYNILQFPSLRDINAYFSGKKQLNEFSLGEKIVLDLIQCVSDLMPNLQLTTSNLRVLLNWMANEGYGSTPERSEDFIKEQLIDVIHLISRNVLINDMYNEAQLKDKNLDKFEYLKRMQAFTIIHDTKKWWNSGTNELYLTWGQSSTGLEKLAITWNNITGSKFSTITDAQGNRLPITRQYTVINHPTHYMELVGYDEAEIPKGYEAALKSNVFYRKSNLYSLGQSCVYVDVRNHQGEVKKISELTDSELSYDLFVNRFLGALNDKNGQYFYIQHTTFADKATIVSVPVPKKITINGKLVDLTKLIQSDNAVDEIKTLIENSVGEYYKTIKDNVLNDYRAIFSKLTSPEKTALLQKLSNLEIDARLSPSIKSVFSRFKDSAQSDLLNNTDPSKWSYDTFMGILLVADNNFIQRLIEISDSLGIAFTEEIHYSKLPSKDFQHYCGNLQLYYYSQTLFGEKGAMEQRYQRQMFEFIKGLYEQDFNISNDGNLKTIVKEFPGLENWVEDDLMILAKDQDGNAINYVDDLIEHYTTGSPIILNPLFERYFYLNFFLSENLNNLFSGATFGHAHKLDKELRLLGTGVTFDEMMLREESARMTASFKRTVDQGVPGVKPIYDVAGIPQKIKIAVVKDLKAYCWNIRGQQESIDSQDGSSLTNPIYNILLRMAQQDCAGGALQKLILRDQNTLYGVNVLEKYADYAMFNADLRNSKSGTGCDMEVMFRAMMNIPFDEAEIPESARTVVVNHADGTTTREPYEIDLTKNLFGRSFTPQMASNGKPIYFNIGGRHFELVSLEKIGKDLYRPIYREVTEINGKVYPISDSVLPANLQKEMTEGKVINTLYDLYTLFGGCYSEDFSGGQFIYGDTSLFTLASYVNNIGLVYNKDGTASLSYPKLETTWQPLKHCFIAQFINQSAVKNGAANVNPESVWHEKNPKLTTMTVRTDSHLQVQDYDHIVTDGDTTLSEFTQVMCAAVQTGASFNDVQDLWNALSNISAMQMKDMTDTVRQAMDVAGKVNPKMKKDLYDIVSKILLTSREQNGSELFQGYINLLKTQLSELKKSAAELGLKVPFSDASGFTTTMINVFGMINRLGIKRKFPGSGLIMVGSYGINKNFCFPGMNYMSYTDTLKWLISAKQSGNKYSSSWKGNTIEIELNSETGELQLTSEITELDMKKAIQLYRIVSTISATNPSLTLHSKNSFINKALEYFDNTNQKYIALQNEYGSDYNKLQVERMKGYIRDVQHTNAQLGIGFKPVTELCLGQCVRIKKYSIGSGGSQQVWSDGPIYIDSLDKLKEYSNPDNYAGFYIDYSEPRDLQPTSIKFTTLDGKRIDIFNLKVMRDAFEVINDKSQPEYAKETARRKIQEELYRIHAGEYTKDDGTIEKYKEGSLDVSDYEARIPRIFANEFKLKPGDSLFEILEEGPSFFIKRYQEIYTPKLSESSYHVCFTKGSGKHDYLTFNRSKTQTEIPVDQRYLKDDGEYIWVTDNDGKLLYPRWKHKLGEDGSILYDTETTENGDEIEVPVLEDCIIQLASPNGASEKLYYCAKPEFAALMYSKHKNDGISLSTKLPSKYRTDVLAMFNELQKNNVYIPGSHQEILNDLSDNSKYFKEVIQSINSAFQLSWTQAQSIFNSFKKSLELIVARIPAQTMQSFMKMKVVGFLDTDSNQIQVSHFQTWIQGSDYKLYFSL